MIWQDIVIASANIVFAYSMLVQVLFGFKRKKGFVTLTTSSLTTLGLVGMSIAMISLKFYASASILIFNAILWFTLIIQRIKYGKA